MLLKRSLFFFSMFTSITITTSAAYSDPLASSQITVKGQARWDSSRAAQRVTDPSVPAFVPDINTPSGIPQTPSVNNNTSEKQPYSFSLQNDTIRDVGRVMAKNGVYFSGWSVSQYSGVPNGGTAHGSFFNENFALGLDFDMENIAGIKGAKIHFLSDTLAGQGHAGDFTGSNWSYLSFWGNHDGLELREFTWDQALFNNRVHILAGRLNPKGGEFEGSELYCLFQAFMCSIAPTLSINGSLPGAPTSSWGARILIKPSKSTYIKGGIWEAEPWLRATNHNAWPGDDWGFDKAQGEYIPIEGGYRTNFSNDLYPRAYDIGFVYDTALYSDPLYNTRGQVRALYGGAAQPRRGRTNFYVQAQQMIWKPEKHGERGLIAFGAANFSTSGSANVKDSYVLGLLDWGPIASRPRDFTGIVFESLVWNRSLVRGMDETIHAKGFGDRWGSVETMAEVNYGVSVAPGVSVVPYLEYIWNPDQIGLRYKPGVNHAMQVGFSLNMQINPALGVPMLHRVRN